MPVWVVKGEDSRAAEENRLLSWSPKHKGWMAIRYVRDPQMDFGSNEIQQETVRYNTYSAGAGVRDCDAVERLRWCVIVESSSILAVLNCKGEN